jgi:hypothetical protein
LLVFVPYAAIYFTAGARRADTTGHALLRGMRPAFAALTLQVLVSSAMLFGLIGFGTSTGFAACWAAAAGLIATMPLLVRAVAGMRSS